MAVLRLRRRFSIKRVCVVADRGMISAETIAELEARGLLYILGVRERADKLVRELVLDDPTPFVPLTITKRRKNIEYETKAVTLAGRRYIVCRNQEKAKKDAADRVAIIASLERQLKKGDKALVGNGGYRRFLATTGENGFVIDRAKAEEDARFDGIFVLRTNTGLSPTDVTLCYKRLTMVEHAVSTAKSLFSTRPIFHKFDETIRGHVSCSFLALVLEAMIQTLIKRKYGIGLSVTSVGRLLAQMGLSCQKLLRRAYEQDATLVKRWMERDFPKLQALAKKERGVVFFSDESGIRSDFHAGTTWAVRGETPVVHHTGKRFHLNMLSAISAKGELRFMTSRKRISAALFIEFLRRLITNYPKKIFLVVDGLPAHKARSVQRFLEGVKDRIELVFLPLCSSEINPDELVWNDVKNNEVGRNLICDMRDLSRAVNSRLRLLQNNPEKVRAFFQMDTTRYAAAI